MISMKNKKGFTLVELMAVIIILIVVMLIAIVVVTQYTKDSKEKAIRADAITFIKLVRDMAGKNVADDSDLDTGLYTVSELKTLGITVTGREPDSGYVFLADYKVIGYCLKYDSFKVTNIESDDSLEKGECSSSIGYYLNDTPSFNFTSSNDYYTFVVPYDGSYLFELWGAQGNDANRGRSSGGKGAYTSGIITLEKGTKLYVYVGDHRSDRSASFNAGTTGGGNSDTANGGSTNGYGGGGATDIRLVEGSWDNSESLVSRIMVAGGGGGATDYSYAANGGYAGSLVGQDGINGKYPTQGVVNVTPTGGSQTAGGSPSATSNTGAAGSFGKGGNGNGSYGSGGGGGYYGGGGGGYTSNSVDSGAGGSSYISGHAGCLAIASSTSTELKEGCTSSSDSEECSIHYSGIKFTNTDMLSGNDNMPKHNGTGTQKGNSGDGYARITLLSDVALDTASTSYTVPGPYMFNVPVDGNYKLEVWGAQGGTYGSNQGGYGSYSVGTIYLKSGETLYVNVGGQANGTVGGYNGGGNSGTLYNTRGGGGATSIASKHGTLAELKNSKKDIIIVAGGGGGADSFYNGSAGGYAGGISGGSGTYSRDSGSSAFSVATGGNQATGGTAASGACTGENGSFGQGGSTCGGHAAGGGGGYYGGGGGAYNSGVVGSGGGGSGYIGSSRLSNKEMFCYNCTESTEELTKTTPKSCAESNPTPECAKIGHGYAKITLIN